MRACLDSLFCCWKSASGNRLFYRCKESEEHGIEYDKLIELPECESRTTEHRHLILNERERHLISNKLYSQYADDQTRYDRLQVDELRQNEEELAATEEQYYAGKAAKVREFYQNCPTSSKTSVNVASVTHEFADFSQRFSQASNMSNSVSDCNSSVYNNPVTQYQTNDSPVELQDSDQTRIAPVPPPNQSEIVDVALSTEQSDKLLETIDSILEDSEGSVCETLNTADSEEERRLLVVDSDESSDISEFYNPDITTLPDVVLGSSPSPGFVELVSSSQTVESEVFDPFREFDRKDAGRCSEESFVEVE